MEPFEVMVARPVTVRVVVDGVEHVRSHVVFERATVVFDEPVRVVPSS